MPQDNSSNNKRIAKNTILLYIRMLLSVVVSLYTSRVVLQTLGVEDYGIYGVVGGVVGMFSFLNASMSGATSRFLTYEMGKQGDGRLNETFSTAMIIHVLIAIGVFVIAESFGLWFLCNKLVIPVDRMLAAHVVYQFSIISMFFTVTQTPYNAIIIAHEKMDVYAYVELLNVFLKLGIVYILLIGNWDKLILYASLTLIVSIMIALIYRVYCLKHYEESQFHFIWDKDILRPMLNFSGWDLYGNMSVVFYTQGITMLLNMFFGPVLNAANNISSTVQGTIKGFAYNVIQAFRPQIIKQYAQGNIDAVNQYCIMATQYTLILYSLIAVPIYIKAEYILDLWLGVVPDHTVAFLRIVLVGTVFNLANNIVNIPIHACGRMKLFSMLTGSCFLISIPLMYVMLKLGASADTSYFIVLLSYFSCLICSLFMLKQNVPDFSLRHLISIGYIKISVCVVIGVAFSYAMDLLACNDLSAFLLMAIVNTVSLVICMLTVVMNKSDRTKLYTYISNKIKI